LWRYRELLYTWTLRDIQVRYKQSLLGAAWAVLQPLSLMVAFSLIFTRLVRIPTGDVPYPVFSYCGLLPWTFFGTSVSFGSTSLVRNLNLVTKVYFPREILPLGAIGAALLDFAVASLIFAGLLVVYGVPVRMSYLWTPVLILLNIVLAAAVTLAAAAVMVFYRDVRFVVPLGLQLWMYATPVIYPLDLIPERLRVFYLLNPMAGIIASYRRVILSGRSPDPATLGSAAALSVGLLAFAYWLFRRTEWRFADVI
jgi:lipopolysaccharide transport system permease protein